MSHDHRQHTPHERDPADAWHTHTVAEKPQQAHAENIAHGTVMVFGVGGFAIIAATVVAMIVYFNWYKTGLLAERQEGVPVNTEADKLRAAGRFDSYEWFDAGKGIVRLKIEDGRRKVAEEYAKAAR